MDLTAIKKQIAGLKPFITNDFYGISNCLSMVIDGQTVPLTVAFDPPNISFVLESKQLTTTILRYSKVFSENQSKIDQLKEAEKSALVQDSMNEITENFLGSDQGISDMVGVIRELSLTYIASKCLKAWYGDEKDSFDIVFSDNKELVDKENAANTENKLFVWTGAIEESAVIQIGTSLTSNLPTEKPAQIPVEVSNEIAEKGVTESVPADKVAAFPKRIRNLPVEDVRPPDA